MAEPYLNRVHGGEDPQAVTFSIEIPDFGWHAAYRVAREFRVVPRLEQEQIVNECLAQIGPTETALEDLEFEGTEKQDDSLESSAGDVNNALANLIKDSKDFLKKRVSWKEFCMGVEETLDEITFEPPPGLPTHFYDKPHARVRPLLESATSKLTSILQRIDSGNRVEAEAYAQKIASENANMLNTTS